MFRPFLVRHCFSYQLTPFKWSEVGGLLVNDRNFAHSLHQGFAIICPLLNGEKIASFHAFGGHDKSSKGLGDTKQPLFIVGGCKNDSSLVSQVHEKSPAPVDMNGKPWQTLFFEGPSVVG